MEFIKKYRLFFLILTVGILLRLINLDKSGGLWYDEMTIYTIASNFTSDLHRFWHFPLYYVFYKTWIMIFGNSDLVIRSMSVFFDLLGIIFAFFAGRQLGINLKIDGKKLGLLYMLLYAINSSFIYYAQEAKFYSLTFLFINILLLCWLKFINKSNIKNFILWCLSSLCLIMTYVSQSLLVLILYFNTFFLLTGNKKYLLFYPVVFIPVVILCLTIPKYFSGNFDAVVYDNSFILLAVQNYFSPLLKGLQNNILSYDKIILSEFFHIKFLLFVLFPVLYLITAQIRALKEYKIARYIFAAGVIYISLHIIFTLASSYNVLVRYTLPALPMLLLVCAAGIIKIKSRKNLPSFLPSFLLCCFIILNLLGILSLSGAPRIQRPDGYKYLAELLGSVDINPASDFVLPIRTELIDKYYRITGKKLSLYTLNKKTLGKEDFIENKITSEFKKFVEENYITGNTLVLLKDISICMFSNEQLKIIASSENFDKYPLQFMRLSKLNNDLITVLSDKMTLKTKIQSKNWEIFVFEL